MENQVNNAQPENGDQKKKGSQKGCLITAAIFLLLVVAAFFLDEDSEDDNSGSVGDSYIIETVTTEKYEDLEIVTTTEISTTQETTSTAIATTTEYVTVTTEHPLVEITTEAPVVETFHTEVKMIRFILNTDTNCLHASESCNAAEKILPENYQVIDIPEADLGNYTNIYWACGKCSKWYSSVLPKFD